MNTLNLIQDTLADSKAIFGRIHTELSQAKNEILVAMAWFTDDELYQVLKDKLSQNVKVSIIISDQVDNEKLDFPALQACGADVIKVKNVGWGIMHQKFCVIDRTTAMMGSYNWTNNAKNNNHEAVIVTNYQKTIAELVTTFFNIQNRAIRLMNGDSIDQLLKDEEAAVATSSTINHLSNHPMEQKETTFYEQSLKEYKDVLDNIIATEVGAFDKELLKTSGYNRAMENSGDHQILPQAMDSLYANFINEIDVVDEKKNRLRASIDEQRKASIANVELKTENEIANLRENNLVHGENLAAEVSLLTMQIQEKQQLIESGSNTKIPFFEAKMEDLRRKINSLSREFVKPPLNWPAALSLSFITILLTLYIFVFYSSVAYIFMFSKEDIKMLQLSGAAIVEAPEVFNPHAISRIWQKGAGGIMFLFLFVAIPLALGMYKVFLVSFKAPAEKTESAAHRWTTFTSFLTKNFGMILIIVVDVFIAYKVAININEMEYITGDVDKKIGLLDILQNGNFWLMFALGALGVFLFSFFFAKIFNLLNERTTTHHQQKTRHEVELLEKDMEDHLEKINEIRLEIDGLRTAVLSLSISLEDKQRQLRQCPIDNNDRINALKQQLLAYKEQINNIGNIYKNQIDNDKLPVSKAEMENRVNIFMEGWSKFLYQEYAVLRAATKTNEAILQCEAWLKGLGAAALHPTVEFNENIISLQN